VAELTEGAGMKMPGRTEDPEKIPVGSVWLGNL
jgi:hypothetical protein